MEKFKTIGIDMPKEIGEVTFAAKFNPHLLKNLAYLKMFYLAAFIALIFATKYHLQINEPSWYSPSHSYMPIFGICVVGMIFLIKWFFWKGHVKIVGVNGFIIYGFRFSIKYPKRTLVLYDDIESLIQYEGGDGWKTKFYRYDFIQNNKVVYSDKVFWDTPDDDDDDLDFMNHILDHWKNYIETTK